MAFGEIYTSLQTGVIDGYEHDASTTLQMRFYEVARYMARTSHIAGVLGLFASTAGLARLPPELRATLEEAAREAAGAPARAGRRWRTRRAAEQLKTLGMTIRDIDRAAFLPAAEALWQEQARELDAARLARRPPAADATASGGRHRRSVASGGLEWATAVLVAAQAAVVGLQVVGRHVLHSRCPGPRRSRGCSSSG